MIPLWIVGGALIGLVVIYMVRPRATTITLSAARFFRNLPLARARTTLFRIAWPQPTRSFFLRLALLMALFAALWSWSATYTSRATASHVGVWLWVDTSASMSTTQGRETRSALALAQAQGALMEAQQASIQTQPEGEFCFTLSAFDMERRDLIASSRDPAELGRLSATLTPRPLGADLALVQRALAQFPVKETSPPCVITHVVVVSDLPAPEWATGRFSDDEEASRIALDDQNVTVTEPLSQTRAQPPIFWIDVGTSQPNAGFTSIEATRNPFTGAVNKLHFELTAYVQIPAVSRLQIIDPSETPQQIDQGAPLSWQETGQSDLWRASVDYAPSVAGRYLAVLLVPDARQNTYLWDDDVYADVATGDQIRVDWRLPDATLPQSLGWVIDTRQPHLRVLPAADDAPIPDDVPLLLVGSGYAPEADKIQQIDYFFEASPLLADVNLDVAERAGFPAQELPDAFAPILRGTNGVWLAQRRDPPGVYLPGLPTGADDAVDRLTTVAFFGAVRWLMQKRTVPPLYRLTTPELLATGSYTGAFSSALEADGQTGIVLHPGEGDTTHPATVAPGPRNWRPTPSLAQRPTWPYWLVAAALLFLVERALTVWVGARWR